MEPKKIAPVASTPEARPLKAEPVAKNPAQQRIEARAAKEKAKTAEPTGPDVAEMRLVIEMDQASGSFIYKTINRLTGEVVQQLPRAEVLKLRDAGQYTAGTVIRTKA